MSYFSAAVLSEWKLPPDVDGDHPPVLSDYFEKVIDEIERNVQAPRGLVLMNLLTVMALSAQARFDVKLPGGPIVPTSLMLLAIADSGERKTAVEKILLKPVRAYQAEREIEYVRQLSEWHVKTLIWEEQRKSILTEFRKKIISKFQCEKDLLHLEEEKPQRPKRPKLLYEDATPEALFSGLAVDVPVGGLISSEGGSILNGRGFRDLEKHNSAWSGAPILIDRKSGDSFDINWLRLTVSMQVQNAPFLKYMRRLGEQSRGIGTWARFLVFEPLSYKGYRHSSDSDKSWTESEYFSSKIKEQLSFIDGFIGCREVKRSTLEFTPKASDAFLCIANQIEKEMRPGFRFSQATDHASKLAENIARVSALFHVFSGEQGGISCESLKMAINVCIYSSRAFMRRFVPPPREYVDAQKLVDWFKVNCVGCRYIRANHILQHGPSDTRVAAGLKAAIDVLIRWGCVRVVKYNRTKYIDLCPGDCSGYINSLVWLPGGEREFLIVSSPMVISSPDGMV